MYRPVSAVPDLQALEPLEDDQVVLRGSHGLNLDICPVWNEDLRHTRIRIRIPHSLHMPVSCLPSHKAVGTHQEQHVSAS